MRTAYGCPRVLGPGSIPLGTPILVSLTDVPRCHTRHHAGHWHDQERRGLTPVGDQLVASKDRDIPNPQSTMEPHSNHLVQWLAEGSRHLPQSCQNGQFGQQCLSNTNINLVRGIIREMKVVC